MIMVACKYLPVYKTSFSGKEVLYAILCQMFCQDQGRYQLFHHLYQSQNIVFYKLLLIALLFCHRV